MKREKPQSSRKKRAAGRGLSIFLEKSQKKRETPVQ
jgi:hypothetical protein